MKLAGKLIFLFIVAVMAVTAVSSHFAARQYYMNVERQHQQIADSMAAMRDQQSFQRAVHSGDHWYFRQVVRTVSPSSMQVRWVWLEQNSLNSYRPYAFTETDRILASRVALSLTTQNPEGVESLVTYCPFQSEGRKGAVEISSPLNPVYANTRRTWLMALVTIGASGLLGIAAVMTAGVRWIAEPLGQLTEKMQRVGEGDFSSDLHIRSNDELGQLATAVNQMCKKLQSQQETIQQRTEQKIRTLEQLRHADRLKTVGQLAAGLAHEVGTPLNVISGRASMILSNNQMPHEKVQSNVKTIKSESERISGIIQKLLDFARRSPVSIVHGDLQEVVAHAVDLIGPLARARDVRIDYSQPPGAAEAEFDFNQMQQVFMNLIDNAVDASPAGGTVQVRLHSGTANTWQVEIQDQGPGMEVAVQEQIFEPFFTTKDVGSGTGLGLSIAHGIVEEHGGQIRFHSQPGQGTTFIVELPCRAQ